LLSVRRVLSTALVLFGTAQAALAFDITGPEVEKGQQQLETIHIAQFGFAPGSSSNLRNAQTLGYSYGLTEVWQIKAGIIADRLDHGDWSASALFVENVFELVKGKQSGGFGLAWFTSVGAATNDEATSAVTFGPIVKFARETLSLTLNPFFDQTFGQNREPGIAFAYGWQLGAQVAKGATLAVAGFGRVETIADAPVLRDQEHKIGPLLILEHPIDDKRSLNLEFGVFFGLTEATADTAAKVKVTYGF
jgi:hypothetical protein